jgi:hypothetical protein
VFRICEVDASIVNGLAQALRVRPVTARCLAARGAYRMSNRNARYSMMRKIA